MVACTYTVAHPWAMMIEFCYAAVAHTTMFGPHWFPYQAGAAEYTEVQTSRLCKFNYRLFLLFFCSFDNSWIWLPRFSKIVEKCNICLLFFRGKEIRYLQMVVWKQLRPVRFKHLTDIGTLQMAWLLSQRFKISFFPDEISKH